MRTTARLGADDHGQPLFRSTQSYPKLWLNPWIECREQRLHGTDAYGRLAGKTQRDDPISVTAAHDRGLVLSCRQCKPLRNGWEYDRPRKLLSNTTLNIDHLITQSLSIDRGLDAVQIFDTVGHPVCSTSASSADLEHATLCLYVEC
jgi:hypothetical protein